MPCRPSKSKRLSASWSEHYKEASFVAGTFRHRIGVWCVLLERTKLFDQNTFALDIDYYLDTEFTEEVLKIPDIRVEGPGN